MFRSLVTESLVGIKSSEPSNIKLERRLPCISEYFYTKYNNCTVNRVY